MTATAAKYNRARNYTGADLALISNAVGQPAASWSAEVLAAVMRWQAQHELVADGKIGPRTLAAMRAAAAPLPVSIPQWAHEIAQLPQACVGLDLSFWQPDLNAVQIAQDGVRFVIIRATEAMGTDSKLASHYAALGAAGLAVSCYHLPHQTSGTWADYSQRDAAPQARYAAKIARLYPASYPLPQMMDLEPDRGDKSKPPRFFTSLVQAVGRRGAAAWISTWLDEFEQRVGAEAGVYGSPALASAGGDELEAAIGNRVRWLAWYLSAPQWVPPSIKGLTSWDLWQVRADNFKSTPNIDESGRCRGVMSGKKACDINLVNPASPLYRKLMELCQP